MSNTPQKIYYDPTQNTLYNADGSTPNTKSSPFIVLTQKSIINISLVTKDSNGALVPYTDLPLGIGGEFLVDDDYSNPSLMLPFETSGWVINNPNEYEYYKIITIPENVYVNGTALTSGVIGSLTTDSWAYDTSVNIRLAGDISPNTLSGGSITFDYDTGTYTPLYVFSNEFNQADTWLDETTGLYRTPNVTDGEISFNINANTVNFYNRIGSIAQNSATLAQVHLYDSDELFQILQFQFICKNIFLHDNSINLEIVGSNYYTKAQTDSLVNGVMPIVSGAIAGNAVALNADGTLYDVGFAPGAGGGGSDNLTKVDANDPTADYLSGKFNTTQFESISAGYYMQIKDDGLIVENVRGLSGELSGKITYEDAADTYIPIVLSGEQVITSLGGSEIFPININDQLRTINAANLSTYINGNIGELTLTNGIRTSVNSINNTTSTIHVVAKRLKEVADTDTPLLLHFDGAVGDTTFYDDGYYSHTVSGVGNSYIAGNTEAPSGFGTNLYCNDDGGVELTSENIVLYNEIEAASIDWSFGCKFNIALSGVVIEANSYCIADISSNNTKLFNIGLRNGYLEYKISYNGDTDWSDTDSIEILDKGYLRYNDGIQSESWNSLLFQQTGDELQVGLNGNHIASMDMTNKLLNKVPSGLIRIGHNYNYTTSANYEFFNGNIDEAVLVLGSTNKLAFIEPYNGVPGTYTDWENEILVEKYYDVDGGLGAEGSERVVFTSGDLTYLSGSNEYYLQVTHNLNERLVDVSLMDNEYSKVIEDDVAYATTDSCNVFLTSYMPITGIWSLYLETGKNKTSSDNVSLNNVNAWTATQYSDLNIESTTSNLYSWDLESHQTLDLTLNENITINSINQNPGATFLLLLKQDTTGTRTILWGSEFKFPDGIDPILTTAANGVDLISFISDGTYMYGVSQVDFQ